MSIRRSASSRLVAGAGVLGVLALAGCNLGVPAVTYETVDETNFPIDPNGLASGDVDGDGDVDLVVAGERRHAVFLNDGAGAFTRDNGQGFAGVRHPSLADVDGDGHLDLVVALRLSGDSVPGFLLGDGAGGFGPPQGLESLEEPPANAALDVVTSDVDGDSDVDVLASAIVSGVPGRSVAVYLNDGTGAFAPRTTYGLGLDTDTVWPVWLDTGDVDGDGDDDLVAVTEKRIDDPDLGSRDVTIAAVALNDGAGAFTATAAGDVEVGGIGFIWPLQPTFADLDEDGDLDLAFGGSSGVTTLLGDGAGGFAAPVRSPVPVRGAIDFVEPADVDGDGHLDLVGSYAPDAAVVVYGDGAGGVDGYQTVIPGTPGPLDRDLLVDDLDGDDDPDIVVVGQDNVMGVLENAIEGRPGA